MTLPIAMHTNRIFRFIRKIFSLLFLQSALLTVFCSPGNGYFSASTQNKFTKTIISRTDALPSSFSYYLVLHDNEKQGYQSNHMNFQLAISPHYSLTEFYMPIIELMTYQKWNYLPSEFSIEDLLYANLKLNRLINEYNSLKERSSMILEGLDVPYLDRPSGFKSPISGNDGALSLKIDNVSNHIKLLTGPAVSTIPQFADINNQTIHNQDLQSKERTPLYTIKKPLNSSSSSSFSNSKSFSFLNRVESEPESEQTTIQDGAQYSNRPNDNLPWIERFAVSMINYFKANKLESIIWLILIFGIYQMLFRTRKR
jgi:hypothetical protein